MLIALHGFFVSGNAQLMHSKRQSSSTSGGVGKKGRRLFEQPPSGTTAVENLLSSYYPATPSCPGHRHPVQQSPPEHWQYSPMLSLIHISEPTRLLSISYAV